MQWVGVRMSVGLSVSVSVCLFGWLESCPNSQMSPAHSNRREQAHGDKHKKNTRTTDGNWQLHCVAVSSDELSFRARRCGWPVWSFLVRRVLLTGDEIAHHLVWLCWCRRYCEWWWYTRWIEEFLLSIRFASVDEMRWDEIWWRVGDFVSRRKQRKTTQRARIGNASQENMDGVYRYDFFHILSKVCSFDSKNLSWS